MKAWKTQCSRKEKERKCVCERVGQQRSYGMKTFSFEYHHQRDKDRQKKKKRKTDF